MELIRVTKYDHEDSGQGVEHQPLEYASQKTAMTQRFVLWMSDYCDLL